MGSRGIRAFDRLVPGAYKADLYRYAVLFLYGGTYNDVAQDVMVPMEELVDIENDRLCLVRDFNYSKGCPGGAFAIQISFMAAAREHPVLSRALDTAIEQILNGSYSCCWLGITGPCHFGRILQEMAPDDFRMDLEQTHFYLKDIKSGKRVIKMRTPNYREGLHTKDGRGDGKSPAHYTTQWKRKTVYGEKRQS